MRGLLAGLIAVLSWCGAPAAATGAEESDAPPRAEVVAARVADALGGAERLAAVNGYRIAAAVRGIGLDGRAVTHGELPGRQRSTLDLGPLSLLLVLDGERGWHRDHNGHVVELSAFEQADAVTSLYIDAFRPWIEPAGGSHISAVRVGQLGDRPCWVVEVHPPDGNPAEIWIDRDTHLPRELRHPGESGLGHEIVRMADYREVDGIQVAHRLEAFHDQLPDNVTHYTVTDVRFGAQAEGGLFGRPAEQSDVTFPPGVTEVGVPMLYREGHLFVQAHLVGAGTGLDGWLMLDSATTMSLLDVGTVGALGIPVQGDIDGLAVGGTMAIQLAQVPFVQVGGVLLEDQWMGVTELAAPIREQIGVDVVGLLGYDFFSRLVVTLDYDGRCTLHHGNTWRVPPGGVTLPLELVDQQPAVRASLDGSGAGLWRLDTGADAVTVHGPAAAAWALLERHGPGEPTGAHGMGGQTAVRRLLADQLRLGSYVIDRPAVFVPQGATGVLRAERLVGNLGNAVLERFEVTLDFSSRRVHLRPGVRFTGADHVRTVDFDVGWLGARVEVLSVEPGGPGEEAGLRPGQQVLRIAGRPALKWTEAELGRLWAGDGPPQIDMVLRDDAGRRRVRLVIPPSPGSAASPPADQQAGGGAP